MLKETEKHHHGIQLNILSCFRHLLHLEEIVSSANPGPQHLGLSMHSLSGEVSRALLN